MELYIKVMVGLTVISAVSNVVLLLKCDTYRPLQHTAVDIVVNAGLTCWGFWVLARNAA